MGQRVLPHKKREPLHATHKPLEEAFATKRFSSNFTSAPAFESFKMSSNQTFGEHLSTRLGEDHNLTHPNSFKILT
jgi:hypothetical protein